MRVKISAILTMIFALIMCRGGGANAQEAYFKDQSLILEGLIGVNFYVTADPSIHHITFNVEGRTDDRAEQTVNASDAATPSGTEYKFTCYVAAPEMANTITATLYDSDGNTLASRTYSVQQYITDFKADAEANPDKYPEYTVNTVEAIADYGHYALEYLAESKGWTLDDDIYNGTFKQIEAVNDFTDDDLQAVEEAVSGYAITKENLEGNGINDIDISLNLDSETSIYFYADVVEDFSTLLLPNVTFSLPYESLTENLYRLKSNGIPAHKLDEAQEF